QHLDRGRLFSDDCRKDTSFVIQLQYLAVFLSHEILHLLPKRRIENDLKRVADCQINQVLTNTGCPQSAGPPDIEYGHVIHRHTSIS
ncbi:MAG: hypothetical protein ABIL11_02195, partial [Chloroflexota bacterium]